MERVVALIRRLHGRVAALRKPILAVAAAVFAMGCIVSFRELNISLGELRHGPLLLLALVFVPLSIAYSAVNMMLMAKAAKLDLGFGQGVRISIYAQVAELLPLPGGAIVRTAALMKAGGSAMRSTGLVLAFSLLWIACAATGAGLALVEHGWPALGLACGGALAALCIHASLARQYGHAVAFAATGLRVAGLCLVALRLLTAFAAVGVAVTYLDSFSFAFATIAGSAASIVPAGLGVSEGLSALLAQPTGVDPASAFLAVALSRLAGFAVNMLIAAGLSMLGKRQAQETARA